MTLSLFSKFWCFSWFRKLPMHSNGCFLMPWRSRNHPRLILDWFGETHFFMKIFIKNVPKIKITTYKKLIWISKLLSRFLYTYQEQYKIFQGFEYQQILSDRFLKNQNLPPNGNTYWSSKAPKKCSMHGITIEPVSAQESC